MHHIVYLESGALIADLRRPTFAHTWTEHVATRQAEVIERLAGASVAVVNKLRLDADTLAALPDLRMVAIAATGYNNIDLEACRAHGIVVSNVRGYARETVPEHVFALLLALARQIGPFHQSVAAGRWQKSEQFCYFDYPIRDLAGRTLGILGMGRIGQGIARRGAHGFGMKVLYHNRSQLPAATEAEVGARYVDLDTLLAQSDHLLLVLPYTPASYHLIDAAALAKMKPSATLVNIARGGLVDEIALADALANGRLAAAGLDVYEGEPKVRPELLALRNVVLTPHIGSASLATRTAMVQLAVDNLVAGLGLDGGPSRMPSAINADAAMAARVTLGKKTGKR